MWEVVRCFDRWGQVFNWLIFAQIMRKTTKYRLSSVSWTTNPFECIIDCHHGVDQVFGDWEVQQCPEDIWLVLIPKDFFVNWLVEWWQYLKRWIFKVDLFFVSSVLVCSLFFHHHCCIIIVLCFLKTWTFGTWAWLVHRYFIIINGGNVGGFGIDYIWSGYLHLGERTPWHWKHWRYWDKVQNFHHTISFPRPNGQVKSLLPIYAVKLAFPGRLFVPGHPINCWSDATSANTKWPLGYWCLFEASGGIAWLHNLSQDNKPVNSVGSHTSWGPCVPLSL